MSELSPDEQTQYQQLLVKLRRIDAENWVAFGERLSAHRRRTLTAVVLSIAIAILGWVWRPDPEWLRFVEALLVAVVATGWILYGYAWLTVRRYRHWLDAHPKD